MGAISSIHVLQHKNAYQEFDQSSKNVPSSPSKDSDTSIQLNSSSMHTVSGETNFTINNNFGFPPKYNVLSASSNHIPLRSSGEFIDVDHQLHTMHGSPGKNWNSINPFGISQQTDRMSAPISSFGSLQSSPSSIHYAKDTKDLPTPSNTPNTSRKSRRRSNLFIPSSKKSDVKLSEFGSGRSIPIKQGYLYKRSSSSLNKEWKKKYVTLCDDGRITYHSSLHDYMDDIHGKEIALNCITVKLPKSQKPRSKSILTNSTLTSSVNFYWKATNNAISDGIAGLTQPKDRKVNESVRESIGKTTSGDEGVVLSNSNSQIFLTSDSNKQNESQISSNTNVKKRHRRIKSSGIKNEQDGNFSRGSIN